MRIDAFAVDQSYLKVGKYAQCARMEKVLMIKAQLAHNAHEICAIMLP